MTFWDPRSQSHGLPRDPFLALVSPRPIGWISTLSKGGIANLAPYSFFNAFSTRPYIVGFSGTPTKDSVVNAAETGEFVVNVATADLTEAMNASSAAVPPETDEFLLAGLAALPGRAVRAPRVKAAKAALECVFLQAVPLVDARGSDADSTLVLGEVVGIHLDESVLVDGRVDMHRLKPLARLGYMDYAVVEETFSMARPQPSSR